MPAYDSTSFDPPAPVARVSLRDPVSGASCVNVPMLLDSGADVTVLPLSVADALGVAPSEGSRFELAGFDGTRVWAGAVTVEMRLCGRLFRGRFVVAPVDRGILGRNILNALNLNLDGPRLMWDAAPASGADKGVHG
jgi:predicted aspartyl protease